VRMACEGLGCKSGDTGTLKRWGWGLARRCGVWESEARPDK